MAHMNTKRFHSLAVTNSVITRSATDLFDSIESVIEDSIKQRVFITVSSNNATDRFTATTGDIITILVFTMADVDEPTIEIHPFIGDTSSSWTATVSNTASGGVWIATREVPSLETPSTNLKEYIDVIVNIQKNEETVDTVSYTPTEYNRVKLFT
jgi:hypothetical protein